MPDKFSRDHLRARIIRSYGPPGKLGPYELVADYEAITENTSRNANAVLYSVESAINAPRGVSDRG